MSRRMWLLVGTATLAVPACCCLVPCSDKPTPRETGLTARERLNDIGWALYRYHEAHGRLPPAVVRDKAGGPLYSWRVEILPYLGEEELYRDFRRDEPWDGEHNGKLLDRMPGVYRPPPEFGRSSSTTPYRVLVGPGTAFERDGLTWDDFPDGLENTILVAEARDLIAWSKPQDLAYDPGGRLPSLGFGSARLFYFACYEVGRRPGFHALFADGSVRFVATDAGEPTLRALITRNGGEPIDWSRVE